AQATHEVAGVDVHRARRRTHPVHGAGVDELVPRGFLQVVRLGVTPLLPQAGDVAPQHDPLARRQREIAAGTHRFAVAALDAAVDLLLHPRVRLEVADVGAGVAVDDDP